MFRKKLLLINKATFLLTLLVCYNSIFINKALANMEQAKFTCAISISSLPLSADKVMLNFTLNNPLNQTITFLTWYTPFEGFLSDLFIIINTDTGEQLEYLGPMVKRLNPEVEDHLTLQAESAISTTLNLAQAYQFTPGSYQLKLKKNTLHIEGKNLSQSLITCDSTAIMFNIKY